MEGQTAFSFDDNDTLAGFRLSRVEVYNWGTFHNKVWSLHTSGKNTLLTGDIGSGKSTIVDAITTLLVPAHRISYNKAAGADTKERSLRSYVQGYYKTERSDSGHGAKPVALRDQNSYTVILGVFSNAGYLQTVTLAQVFWVRDPGGQPERFFVVADSELTISEHFSRFGTDIRNLKKSLKSNSSIEVFDTFPPYCAAFRRRFGIENEQALELFHQTVSMKSVGNLTDFVRTHMLEAFDVAGRIDALITHFDDLNRAHESVLKAKTQIERLKPISADLDKYDEFTIQRELFRQWRDHLNSYFAYLKAELLNEKISDLTLKYQKLNSKIESVKELLAYKQAEREQLRQALAQNGGDRIERIQLEIKELSDRKTVRMRKTEEYRLLVKDVALSHADTVEVFYNNRTQISLMLESVENNASDLQNRRTETEVELKEVRDNHTLLSDEIASLEKRRSNISSHQIGIRKDLCSALGIGEDEVPFAGELIQVYPEEVLWEGAIERLLHNFGLSLLVPERHYAKVTEWVDSTNLRGRIVYFKISRQGNRTAADLHPDSLVRKVSIKPDCESYSWLEFELSNRFDYACCRSIEQFRKEKQAITVTGQVKSIGNRHEKDDRHDIGDRSRYILGWSNEAKINTLKGQRKNFESLIQTIVARLVGILEQQKLFDKKKESFVRLDSFTEYEEIDWKSIVLRIEDLEDELKTLKESSDILKTINERLSELEPVIRETDAKLDALKDERSKNEEKQNQAEALLVQCRELLEGKMDDALQYSHEIDSIRMDVFPNQNMTAENADQQQPKVRDAIQSKIDNHDKKVGTVKDRLIRTMQDYCRDYQAETVEVDAKIESGTEFKKMLAQLQSDDLPKFESRFKALLNENTIREIANFQSQLNRERQDIRDRIDRINLSLKCIEYNRNRYIVLEAQENSDIEIKDFRQALRACTEGALTGSQDDQYTEVKYLHVKSIIDRFRGRDGSAEMDKRWTAKVTDVRNWFSFAASERWMEDHSEYEHYTDSGGKSGGQKEKLAYTVLAASLAYQFGLEWGEVRSRSFRFVVIDEAFGRGSDESAGFGLELFKKLNLQLLIVTPLQKIHIIEPYVSTVGFVYSPEGRESLLRSLTIEEYMTEKDCATAK